MLLKKLNNRRKKAISLSLIVTLMASSMSFAAPKDSGIETRELIGRDRYHTAVKISQEFSKTIKSDTVVIVNGEAIADGLTATPLASIENAPILLTEKDNLPNLTKEELKRLSPSNVIVIGGEGSISSKAIDDIKALIPNVTIERLGGKDRYETSLKIAQAINEENAVKEVYIGYGYGEADALSISSKAGKEKQPIVLTEKSKLPNDTYDWLKSKGLETAYFIGGEGSIQSSVIDQVDKITKSNVSYNRIAGKDRHETNARVIERFYGDDLKSALVTKSDVLVDALTAGPLAAKLDSPVIITDRGSVAKSHEEVLDKKNTELVYRVGGGIKDNIFDSIVNMLRADKEPPVVNPVPPQPPINPDDDLLDPDNPKWSIDSDRDGLMDAEEELIGTNPNKTDTDEDGLNDKFELEAGLDATKKDSDDNGTLDPNEDLDGDGLKNIYEQKYNTSAILEDTDGDVLNDYEEVNKYKTNPLEKDTDKDGIIDGREIELGIYPNKKDSNGNGINDGDEKYEIDIKTPESDKSENIDINIEGSVSGKSIDDLYIINMENAHEFINSDIPGYIAPPFRVGNNSEGATENVNVRFTLDSQVLKSNSGDEFAVYRYNKEKQILEVVSESKKLNYTRGKDYTFTINNIALGMDYYEYIVLNKTKWDEAWSKDVLDPGNESGLLDIVLTIDSSGSMDWNDPNDLRKQESIDFINELDGENRAAVVDFDSRAKIIQNLTTDKNLLARAINKIDSSGGTNISDGLRKSIDVLDSTGTKQNKDSYEDDVTYNEIVDDKGEVLKEIEDVDYVENIDDISEVEDIIIESYGENRNKFIMLLTDGESSVDTRLIEEAKAKSIKIYTIGLGAGVDSKVLENISKETDGKYQHGETSEDFEQIFKELADGTINLIQDTDKDGIPDYFEMNMRLVGGVFVTLNPNKKDTDEDGIDDGEEITGKKNPTPEDFHNMYIKEQRAFLYHSRPDLKDTDKDGINDNEDEEPKNGTVTPTLLLKASDLSYENTVDDVLLYVKDVEFEVRDLPSRGLDDIGGWKIIGSNDPNGFGAVVLKKGNQIIIAYTGSADIFDIYDPDWTEDYIKQHLLSALLKESYQRDLAIDLLDFIVDGYGSGCNIYITGHSLGGYLAQVATYKLNYETPNGRSIFKETVTFNTEPILNDRMLDKYKSISLNKVESLGIIGNDKLVHNYHIKNDILHKYLITLFNKPIMGGSKRIFYSEYDSGEAHKLTNFYGKNLTFYNN